MIDLKTIQTGEYIVVTSAFHDYGKVGNVFRIIDGNMPGEPTAALAWMINQSSGQIEGQYTYKIPCDKVDLMPRKDLATLLEKNLKKLESKVNESQKAYDVLKKRVDGLRGYYSKDAEMKDVLENMFSFIEIES